MPPAGRWNGVSVAVKIIEHSERSPGTASSGGKRISIVRESLLATQMSHPNIVSVVAVAAIPAASICSCRGCAASAASAGHSLHQDSQSLAYNCQLAMLSMQCACVNGTVCSQTQKCSRCSRCCSLQVQSYHISTMTVSERNALAKGWLGAEAGTSPAPKQSPKPSSSAQQGGDDDEDSSGSNHSSDNEQRDVLETVS